MAISSEPCRRRSFGRRVVTGHRARRCASRSAGQQANPDPFFRDNEAKLQWIDEASWEYQLNFDVPAALLGRANVDLVFDGLDAAAEVYLNDAKVLDADNMFRVWRVPVKANLHAGKNVLRVVFPSPIKAAEKVAATDPWQPKTKTAAKTYIRKAAYEYGWDWGPTICDQRHLAAGADGGVGQGADCGLRHPAARCEQGSGASGCGGGGGGGECGACECQRGNSTMPASRWW